MNIVPPANNRTKKANRPNNTNKRNNNKFKLSNEEKNKLVKDMTKLYKIPENNIEKLAHASDNLFKESKLDYDPYPKIKKTYNNLKAKVNNKTKSPNQNNTLTRKYRVYKGILDSITSQSKDNKNCSDILKYNIELICKYGENYINSFPINKETGYFETLYELDTDFKRQTAENYKAVFKKICADALSHDHYTVAINNIICLQLTMLFTNILLAQGHKFGLSNADTLITAKALFNEINYYYSDYDKLYRYINAEGDIYTRNLIATLIQNVSYYKKYNFDTYKVLPYEYCPILPGTNLCLFAGELNISDMVISLANEIYLVGVSITMEHADGDLLTPFEFMYHDLVHNSNRIESIYMNVSKGDKLYNIRKHELEFIDYINNSNLSNEEIYDIYLYMFIILHESLKSESSSFKNPAFAISENSLNQDYNSNKPIQNLSPAYLTEPKDWLDPYSLGGLLPDTRTINGKTYVIKNNWENIKKYIRYIQNLFYKTRNNKIKTN